MAFVHLHNHSEYSLHDGITHVKDMVKRAADLGMPAIALTDHGVMGGCIELCDACAAVEKSTGKKVKPIYGCEVYMVAEDEVKRSRSQKRYHLILLAKTTEGYHNLIKLVSESHVDNFYMKPLCTQEMLRRYSKGLICSSACMAGIIPHYLDNGDFSAACEWARKLASYFEPGDFYIELQDAGYTTNNGRTQRWLNEQLCAVARECGFKTIATNDFHFLLREDARAQDIIRCIGQNRQVSDTNRMIYSHESYMKTEEEMREALAGFEEACDNTIEVAEKCNVEIARDSILPIFPVPEGYDTVSYFRHQIEVGLVRRYGENVPQEVMDRYEYEAGIIIQQGFPAYFLIVQEYITWARDHGIVVGPGRGSAAGSLVSYAMGITDLDPLENGLLFERFLSPERVEMPDIDVDFDDERRGEVIEHIKEFYGEDHVSGVITYGRIAAKNAVRDAARVLGYPYATGDQISKLIDDGASCLDEAVESSSELKELYNTDPSVRETIDAAKLIEGLIRNEGVHACATIICRDPMSDHVPMKRDTKKGAIITQYDGHYTPELGLLKMDFLGLRTLGVLSRACNSIYNRYGVHLAPEEIPINDEAAFEFLRNGNMDGLFQVESALYVSLFHRFPPRTFANIVASIALNRPGPLESGMVDDYVNVACGKVPAHYYDERLRPILEETYGTIVYQEQIMQISMRMSGFSAGKADKLRKAMGKKNIDVMKELQNDWNEGAVENGFSLEIAKQIWNDAEKFAKYAFNKSHSAAYAVLVMRTAYLKAHYPFDYMAAVLSSYMGKTDDLIKYVSSCNHSGIPVMPPDINSSNVEFTAVEGGVRFGLMGVKGVGKAVADAIIAERKANGPYTSLHDLLRRVDAGLWNKKSIEALIKGGAFDSTGYTRKQLNELIYNTTLLDDESKAQRKKALGQTSIFETEVLEGDESVAIPEPDGIEWPDKIRNSFEKEVMGMYVSNHPLAKHEDEISKITPYTMAGLKERSKEIKKGVFVGMVQELSISTYRSKRDNKEKRMANFSLEDITGSVACVCFSVDDYHDALHEDAIVKIVGKFDKGDRGDQIMANEISEIEFQENDEPQIGKRPEPMISISLTEREFTRTTCDSLIRIIKDFPGVDRFKILVSTNSGKKLETYLPVLINASDTGLRYQLNELFGREVA